MLTFLSPWLLLSLLAVPAVVLLHWVRSRRRAVTVPSLIIWKRIQLQTPPRRTRAIVFDTALALQISGVVLIGLALAGLVFQRQAVVSRRVVIVIDDGMGMSARAAPGDSATRLDAVKRFLADKIWPRLDAADQVTLLLATGGPARILTPDDARKEVDRLSPTALASDAVRAAGDAMGLARAGDAVIVLTDSDPPPGFELSGPVAWIGFGGPSRNVAITACQADDRNWLLAVRNCSPAPASAVIRTPDGDRTADLAPDETLTISGTIMLAPDTLDFSISSESDDRPIDNAALLVRVDAPRVFIRGTCRSADRHGWRKAFQAAGAEILEDDPAAARPGDLALFIGAPPLAREARARVRTAILYVKPPPGTYDLWTFDRDLVNADRVAVNRKVAILDNIDFAGIRLPAAQSIKAPGMTPWLRQDRDVLAGSSSDRGAFDAVLAFDPEDTNWVDQKSFPVFATRLLEASRGRRPLCRYDALVTGDRGADWGLLSPETMLRGPGGVAVRAGERLERPGVYETAVSGMRLAVNAIHPEESMKGVTRESPPPDVDLPAGLRTRRTELAPWLAALALACFAAEWVLTGRRR
jgi:hypothetical protein